MAYLSIVHRVQLFLTRGPGIISPAPVSEPRLPCGPCTPARRMSPCQAGVGEHVAGYLGHILVNISSVTLICFAVSLLTIIPGNTAAIASWPSAGGVCEVTGQFFSHDTGSVAMVGW